MSAARPLAGRTVVVTRASDQAGPLVALLEAQGASVLEVPTIELAEPADNGAALREAAARSGAFDWVVVTSPNGAERLAASLPAPRPALRLAVVGPGTAAAASRLGLPPALVPQRFVAEGLLEAFPPGPGRVLVAQAEGARPVLVEGLRARGWQVEAVAAYRTVPAHPSRAVVDAAGAADAITFTSGSTVTGYLAAAGLVAVPAVVVCIGPVTAEVATAAGLQVSRVAAEHTLAGLVAAVVHALAD